MDNKACIQRPNRNSIGKIEAKTYDHKFKAIIDRARPVRGHHQITHHKYIGQKQDKKEEKCPWMYPSFPGSLPIDCLCEKDRQKNTDQRMNN